MTRGRSWKRRRLRERADRLAHPKLSMCERVRMIPRTSGVFFGRQPLLSGVRGRASEVTRSARRVIASPLMMRDVLHDSAPRFCERRRRRHDGAHPPSKTRVPISRRALGILRKTSGMTSSAPSVFISSIGRELSILGRASDTAPDAAANATEAQGVRSPFELEHDCRREGSPRAVRPRSPWNRSRRSSRPCPRRVREDEVRVDRRVAHVEG